METPIPNPFNGAEMFNGQSHHRAPVRPGHPGFDDEDFGPETDVDMVDDVLLSPAIAAAKALVHGTNEDDYERQRQQMKEFDDPVDLERSRDTPTPPAHEVAKDVSGDNLAESGGEESEEEWNYIPGKDTQNQASAQAESKQDEEDMNSRLNPDAAEFVPVSPTKLLMDEPIIASSPARGLEKSLDNIQLPSEFEFTSEISQRPGDLEYSNGPKHGEDCFDNISTLQNIKKEFNPSLPGSEMANEAVSNFNKNSQEHSAFDKFAAVQNIEEKVTSAVLEKANMFGMNNDFSNNAFEAMNIFGKSDPMTASFMGKDLPSSPEPEDALVPGTPRSTTVEAPSSPAADEISPAIHQTELDSPIDDFVTDNHKSPDAISPGDGPQEGISAQERTSSSGFESESGADEVDPNIVSSEGPTTEHRRSSTPVDLSFEPNQTFGDTNPFGTMHTQSSTNAMDQFDITEKTQETKFETPKKEVVTEKYEDQFDFMQNAPSCFVSPRFHGEADVVPFDHLESPEGIPGFAHPPNRSFLATELTKTSECQDDLEDFSPIKSELNESQAPNYKTNVNDIKQNLFSDDTDPEMEETSFTTEKPQVNELFHVKLDSTEGALASESKIMLDEKECEQTSKLDEDLKINSELLETEPIIPSPVSPKAVEQVLAKFDDIKIQPNSEVTSEYQEVSRDSDIDVDTKEMDLEFESHIAKSQNVPEIFGNVMDEGFEMKCCDKVTEDVVQSEDLGKHIELCDNIEVIEIGGKTPEEIIGHISSAKETNPFRMDDGSDSIGVVSERLDSPLITQNNVNVDFTSAVDQFSAAVDENLIPSEQFVELSTSQLEPDATKTVSYQTLTPANEPQITQSNSYITGEEEKVESSILNEFIPEDNKPTEIPAPVEAKEQNIVKEETPASLETEAQVVETAQKIEPLESTVVTETLITALEETSEVPSLVTTDVPSSAGTPPPTPAPEMDNSKELQGTANSDIILAAAAGAMAATTAIVVEKEIKKTKDTTAKKPTVGAKKPSDATAKSTAKSTTKAPAAKPAASGPKATTTTNTTKLTGTTTSSTTKPSATKSSTTSTALKKSTSTAPPRTTTARSSTLQANARPTTTATKTVPKQLPISKPTAPTLKAPSKTPTPNSKPTTPTTPKADPVKSPAKAASKSLLTTKPSPKPASDKATEKKPLTNGDIKPLPKRAEVPKKPTPTTRLTGTKPPTKTTPSSTAAPKAPVAASAARPRPASAVPKPPTASTVAKPTTAATRRPATAPTAKTTNGKEAVYKQSLSAKPTMNGKSAGGLKKTDPKANVSPGTKPPPIRKPAEVKKEEEKPAQVQESNVPTTNGFTDHSEDQETLKIEDLAPTAVETVN